MIAYIVIKRKARTVNVVNHRYPMPRQLWKIAVFNSERKALPHGGKPHGKLVIFIFQAKNHSFIAAITMHFLGFRYLGSVEKNFLVICSIHDYFPFIISDVFNSVNQVWQTEAVPSSPHHNIWRTFK